MNESLKQLCMSYFSGKADESVSRRIIEFLHASPENVEIFREWEKEWKLSESPSISQIREYKRVRSRINARVAVRYSLVGISVAAVIALTAILFPFWNGGKPADPLILEPHIFSVETRYCEQTKVVLPDSTVVWLNAVLACHIFASGQEGAWIQTLCSYLRLEGEVTMLDHSPMFMRNVRTNNTAAALSAGQIRLHVRYGLLRMYEPVPALFHANRAMIPNQRGG